MSINITAKQTDGMQFKTIVSEIEPAEIKKKYI